MKGQIGTLHSYEVTESCLRITLVADAYFTLCENEKTQLINISVTC